MDQVDSETFNVAEGETITLTIVSHKVAQNVGVSFMDTTIAPSPADPQNFVFKIAKNPVSQFADVQCHFSAADDDGAFYQFFVTGSVGDTDTFTSASVRKTDLIKEINLQFTIA